MSASPDLSTVYVLSCSVEEREKNAHDMKINSEEKKLCASPYSILYETSTVMCSSPNKYTQTTNQYTYTYIMIQ